MMRQEISVEARTQRLRNRATRTLTATRVACTLIVALCALQVVAAGRSASHAERILSVAWETTDFCGKCNCFMIPNNVLETFHATIQDKYPGVNLVALKGKWLNSLTARQQGKLVPCTRTCAHKREDRVEFSAVTELKLIKEESDDNPRMKLNKAQYFLFQTEDLKDLAKVLNPLQLAIKLVNSKEGKKAYLEVSGIEKSVRHLTKRKTAKSWFSLFTLRRKKKPSKNVLTDSEKMKGYLNLQRIAERIMISYIREREAEDLAETNKELDQEVEELEDKNQTQEQLLKEAQAARLAEGNKLDNDKKNEGKIEDLTQECNDLTLECNRLYIIETESGFQKKQIQDLKKKELTQTKTKKRLMKELHAVKQRLKQVQRSQRSTSAEADTEEGRRRLARTPHSELADRLVFEIQRIANRP